LEEKDEYFFAMIITKYGKKQQRKIESLTAYALTNERIIV